MNEGSGQPLGIPADGDADTDADTGAARPGAPPSPGEREVEWLAAYVYGTIATLVAIAGLTFEKNPGALTTAGVVVVGAVAIWFAHALSQLITRRSWKQLELTRYDVRDELKQSWSIVTAAIPATLVFVLAGIGVFKVKTAFTVAEVVGVLALAVVGIGTAGSGDRPLGRRILYVLSMVLVGVLIVLLELAVHLL